MIFFWNVQYKIYTQINNIKNIIRRFQLIFEMSITLVLNAVYNQNYNFKKIK